MTLPADLAPARLLGLLETRWLGRTLDVRESTESTMDDALVALDRGAPTGATFVADTQRRGRGSQGRAWESPPGQHLYVSFVLRRDHVPPHLPVLTLAAGLGIARVCERLAPEVTIKWPNDVLLGDRKCAGILVESKLLGTRWSGVVGFGVNVGDAVPSGATSLRATAPDVDRGVLLARLLASVESEIDRFDGGGPEVIVPEVAARLAWRGERVRIDDTLGVLHGLDADGAVRVGERSYRSGRITRA